MRVMLNKVALFLVKNVGIREITGSISSHMHTVHGFSIMYIHIIQYSGHAPLNLQLVVHVSLSVDVFIS